jgi:hypothetical protein
MQWCGASVRASRPHLKQRVIANADGALQEAVALQAAGSSVEAVPRSWRVSAQSATVLLLWRGPPVVEASVTPPP